MDYCLVALCQCTNYGDNVNESGYTQARKVYTSKHLRSADSRSFIIITHVCLLLCKYYLCIGVLEVGMIIFSVSSKECVE